MPSHGLLSADSGNPTGARTPADALGEPKRMSASDSERQESYECPECGDAFTTERGRDSHIDQVHGRPWQDANRLRKLYVEQKLSSMDLAERFGVSDATIRNNLQANDIPIRSTQESHRAKAPDELRDGDTLRRLYTDDNLTVSEIADRVDVSFSTVIEWMNRHGIKRSYEWPTGEDHWSWNGGTESVYYGANWTEQRDAARERDGHECQICGHAGDGRALDVHHIQPLRSFDTPEAANALDNLITLCRPCHRRWEGIPLRPQPGLCEGGG